MEEKRSKMSQCKIASTCVAGTFIAGALLFSAGTIASFDPVLTSMSCNQTAKEFGQERFGADGVHVNGTATTVCSNRNRFAFHVNPIEDTKVLLVLGDDVSTVGSTKDNKQVYPPHGDAIMYSDTVMHINMTQLRGIMDYHSLHGEPMMASVSHVWARVEVEVLGFKVRSPWFEKTSYCGWSVDPMKRLNGPLTCEHTLAGVQAIVKPANATTGPFEVPCPPEKIAQAEWARDCACAVLVVVCVLVLIAVVTRLVTHWMQIVGASTTIALDAHELSKAEEGRLEGQELKLTVTDTANCDAYKAYKTAASFSTASGTTQPSTPSADEESPDVLKARSVVDTDVPSSKAAEDV
eukprot:TRINITY_DN17408_c0_g1_i1.p1 TRINITY_DN17408_c0_g1~~TRINITY_DN17408_c0_g1_i1.p1  ORF type:complete len:390 (-),score=40.13 TRINITY_DN17408_c0_g1_i1:940-1992(-)